MDHQKIYTELMRTRQALARRKKNDGSLESHHIKPKCLGGDDSAENRILLTPREHFIAHLLLVRFQTGEARAKMSYALLMMTRNNPNQVRIFTSAQYVAAKFAVAQNCSGENHPSFGSKHSETRRKAISERMSGKGNHRSGKKPWNFGLTTETSPILKRSGEKYRQFLVENPDFYEGRGHSDETRRRMSESARGRPKSDAHRRRLSQSLKGRKISKEIAEKTASKLRGGTHPQVRCPRCGKEGGATAMYRWHFEACGKKQPVSEETRAKMSAAKRKVVHGTSIETGPHHP